MGFNLTITKLVILSTFIINIFAYPMRDDKIWTLRILHTNDMHATFEETSGSSMKCSTMQTSANKCYGGFARIATLVRQARNSTTPALFLNAGNTFRGSDWFTVHKWKIVSKFLQLLKPDAISLGNHEFDDGIDGLVPFINEISKSIPVVASNLDLTNEPNLLATNISKSVVLKVDGRKIGIIGYLTPKTRTPMLTRNVIFDDEIAAIRGEVKKLKAQDINILIALGHSGFNVDKKIAEEVEDIDLVIGGHTNTFLYNGVRPSTEKSVDAYPAKIIQKKSNRTVYVVQAYAYTKYLGNMTINFDNNGEIVNIAGNPTFVNGSVSQAQDVLDELEKWRPAVMNFSSTAVGYTNVFLQGNRNVCQRLECNLGNLIVDSMVDYNAIQHRSNDKWTDAPIAIFNSGSITTSIDKNTDNPIMLSDIKAVFPYHDEIGKINMTGSELLEVIEQSVSELNIHDFSDFSGRFLQYSGIQVIYDLFNPVGSRVRLALVRCADCEIPTYEPLVNSEMYTVILNDYIYSGGDQFEMLKQYSWTPLNVTVDQALISYIKNHSPVYPAVEFKITFVTIDGHNEWHENISNTNDDINDNNIDSENTRNNDLNFHSNANQIRMSLISTILMAFILVLF